MMLRPIRWVCHVQATKSDDMDPPNVRRVHTIEMEVNAVTKEDAGRAAAAKAAQLGYIMWSVRTQPRPQSEEKPVIEGTVLALPAPKEEEKEETKDSLQKLMEGFTIFYWPFQKPKYAQEITHDSCP